ncbi:MAG: MSMEG_4193 family putative phosphomutase [Anaerolineales bacterium]|nr:MSMEG_4193 family putative phosphomutase [Anaerolineales bacterium]
MTQLLLIRHGENDYTRTGRLAGWMPGIGLNEVGRRQALALAEKLKEVPLVAIYSSPLERARETAAPLAEAKKLTVEIVEELGEVRYGAWQGKSLKRLARTKLWRMVQSLPSAMQFPQGETFRAVQSRAVEAVEGLVRAHPKDQIAVFSHGDVIKLIVAHYIGLPLDLFQRLVIATASITTLRLGQGQPALVKLNDTSGVEVAKPPTSRKRSASRRS